MMYKKVIQKNSYKEVFIFLLIIFLQKIYAKPVKVEEILTYKNEWQLDLGISYSNIEKSSGESQLTCLFLL